MTQDDLQAYYNQHRDQYRVAEQAKVSHILIKTPLPGADGKIDEKGVAEAQKRAQDVLKQLKAGAKFEDLAKKYSEDPGSAKEGGSLGWIGKGPDGSGVRESGLLAAQRTDQRPGEEQLWFSHYSRR